MTPSSPLVTIKIPTISRPGPQEARAWGRAPFILQPIMQFKDDGLSASQMRHEEWKMRLKKERARRMLDHLDQHGPTICPDPSLS